MDNNQTALLSEIRDLLKEQNTLIADIKAMNVEAAGRNLLAMDQTGEWQASNNDALQRARHENRKTFIVFILFLLDGRLCLLSIRLLQRDAGHKRSFKVKART